jgi:hypothetical protein
MVRRRIPISGSTTGMIYELKALIFVYFFGGLECVGHSLAYVAHFVFLRYACSGSFRRTYSARPAQLSGHTGRKEAT